MNGLAPLDIKIELVRLFWPHRGPGFEYARLRRGQGLLTLDGGRGAAHASASGGRNAEKTAGLRFLRNSLCFWIKNENEAIEKCQT